MSGDRRGAKRQNPGPRAGVPYRFDMTQNDSPNTSSISTKFSCGHTKMAMHPQGTKRRAAGTPPQPLKRRRSLRASSQVTLTYVGGPEGSIVVKGNGASWRYHGCWTLVEVLDHWCNVVIPRYGK